MEKYESLYRLMRDCETLRIVMKLIKRSETKSDFHHWAHVGGLVIETAAELGHCEKCEMKDKGYDLMNVIYRSKWAD